MIQFGSIEERSNEFRDRYVRAKPFSHVVIDSFCDPAALQRLVSKIPDPRKANINKSRDYVFAKNKFEKSSFRDISSEFAEICDDFLSKRFESFLRKVTGDEIFIDESFHGGGIHQGGKSSFLDMHADFNFHPLHSNWFRSINILLYLNDGWKPEFGGALKLRHSDTDERAEIEPVFNRCVIMKTREFTLHGYDPIAFPEGSYRRSIAAYGYKLVDQPADKMRSTTWYPERSGIFETSYW
jgi:Rps23 Pro-64 3,4-dihydroxylase Tpa1-like proline 4-hydroxylase